MASWHPETPEFRAMVAEERAALEAAEERWDALTERQQSQRLLRMTRSAAPLASRVVRRIRRRPA